jgi:hypothetical protein
MTRETTTDYTVHILKVARSKIVAGWCQGKNAVDSRGVATHPESGNACRYCIHGAIFSTNASANRQLSATYLVQRLIAERSNKADVTGFDVANWNDDSSRTQAEVVQLFDDAIAEAEARLAVAD